jgi:hypothetical protein
MALGMAEYRSGHWAESDATLLAASSSLKNIPWAASTSALYRAMSMFRQGKKEEARQLAVKAITRMRPLPKDETNPLAGIAPRGEWNNTLHLWMAYKEAKALIKFDEKSGTEDRTGEKAAGAK